MKIRFEYREEFTVYGYAVETVLSSCEGDVGQLWAAHEKALLAMPQSRHGLYGVMWYTQSHRYFYHLGVEGEEPPQKGMAAATIPAARFAVATVPKGMDTVEGWTRYFDEMLPPLGLVPDAKHGRYFELYSLKGGCELWTPVKQAD